MAQRDDYELSSRTPESFRSRPTVVAYDVQLAPWVGLRDLLEELQELLVAMPRVAGVGHLASGNFRRREQALTEAWTAYRNAARHYDQQLWRYGTLARTPQPTKRSTGSTTASPAPNVGSIKPAPTSRS
jgi:hypothetical protein